MGVFVNDLSTPLCDACAQGKAKRHVSRQAHRAAAVLKLVHTDVSGPIPAMFFSEQYYVIFKDDYTDFKKLYFMKMKNETAKCFEKYKNLIENCKTLPRGGAATGQSCPSPSDKGGVREQCTNMTIYDQL